LRVLMSQPLDFNVLGEVTAGLRWQVCGGRIDQRACGAPPQWPARQGGHPMCVDRQSQIRAAIFS